MRLSRIVVHISFFYFLGSSPEITTNYDIYNIVKGETLPGKDPLCHKIYLIVVSLNQTDLATREDIDSGLVNRVRLFKAKTWEELKMIAADNKYMESAVES